MEEYSTLIIEKNHYIKYITQGHLTFPKTMRYIALIFFFKVTHIFLYKYITMNKFLRIIEEIELVHVRYIKVYRIDLFVLYVLLLFTSQR